MDCRVPALQYDDVTGALRAFSRARGLLRFAFARGSRAACDAHLVALPRARASPRRCGSTESARCGCDQRASLQHGAAAERAAAAASARGVGSQAGCSSSTCQAASGNSGGGQEACSSRARWRAQQRQRRRCPAGAAGCIGHAGAEQGAPAQGFHWHAQVRRSSSSSSSRVQLLQARWPTCCLALACTSPTCAQAAGARRVRRSAAGAAGGAHV